MLIPSSNVHLRGDGASLSRGTNANSQLIEVKNTSKLKSIKRDEC